MVDDSARLAESTDVMRLKDSSPSTNSFPSEMQAMETEEDETFALLIKSEVMRTVTERLMEARRVAKARAGLMWPCAGKGRTRT